MADTFFGNRIRVLTATTGTGTVTLGAAINNSACTFAEGNITNGQQVTYVIEEGLDFEVGRGVYTSAGTTLTRATVLLSKINGTAGTTKMTLAGAASVSVVASALDLTLLSADKGIDFLPYYTATTTSGTTPFRPGGKALAGIANPVGKWNIPYFTTNTVTSSLAGVKPTGLGLLLQNNPQFKWNVPYFTSNSYAEPALAALRPGGVALIGLAGTAANNIVYLAASNTATTTPISDFAKNILDDLTQTAVRTTIGAQASDTELTALAGLTSASGKVPYFTGSGTAALATMKPSGESLLGLVGTSAKWQVPYLTSNTNSTVAVSAIRPGGLSILGLASAAANNLVFLAAANSAATTPISNYAKTFIDDLTEAAFKQTVNLEIGTDVQQYDQQLAALAGLAPTNWQVPYFTASTTASITTAKPSGLGFLGLVGTSAKWMVPYMTSNTLAAPSTSAVTPPGLGLVGMINAAGKWNIPYFTTNTGATSAVVKPSGMGLLQMVGTSAKWMVPYMTSNTLAAPSTSAVTPSGLAVLGVPTNLAAKWNIPYFTTNTAAGIATSTVKPGGLALLGLVGAADQVPYFSGNTATGATTTSLSSFARTFLDDASANAVCATIGAVHLGTSDQVITGGARVTVLDLGNLSGTTKTPDPGDRPMQKITNNGAGTIAPGSNYGNYILDVINTTGAGAITVSGWSDTAGDAFTTTTTDKFRCYCSVTADGSLLQVRKIT